MTFLTVFIKYYFIKQVSAWLYSILLMDDLILFCYRQYDKPSENINVVLKDLGFVCNSDKMYTFYPSQIYYYENAQKHITKYGQKNYIAPKPKVNICFVYLLKYISN